MILIDDRTGSKEFLRHLRNLGTDCDLVRLDAADFAWTGNGQDGPIMVGLERKTIGEIVDQLRSKDGNRLVGDQLRKMREAYHKYYLLVEGIWMPDRDTGALDSRMIYKSAKPILYKEVMSYITTLVEIGKAEFIRSATEYETACQVQVKYKWWQKEYEDHHALDMLYTPVPGRGTKARAFREEPSLAVRWAAAMDGIGRKAWDVGDVGKGGFATAEDLAIASAERWEQIIGIGKKGAKSMYEQIRRRGR